MRILLKFLKLLAYPVAWFFGISASEPRSLVDSVVDLVKEMRGKQKRGVMENIKKKIKDTDNPLVLTYEIENEFYEDILRKLEVEAQEAQGINSIVQLYRTQVGVRNRKITEGVLEGFDLKSWKKKSTNLWIRGIAIEVVIKQWVFIAKRDALLSADDKQKILSKLETFRQRAINIRNSVRHLPRLTKTIESFLF